MYDCYLHILKVHGLNSGFCMFDFSKSLEQVMVSDGKNGIGEITELHNMHLQKEE